MGGKAILYIIQIFIIAALPAWLLGGCVTASESSIEMQSRTNNAGIATHRAIKLILDKGGSTMDYDTLMRVHQMINQSVHPIPKMDQLLYQLIHKRNTNPRIDQMILIFSAKTIAESKFSIPYIQEIIKTILDQDDRINEWVIAFVAEAISNYPYDLPQGDRLVDNMENRLSQIRSIDRSQEEYFGYHFLPPPKRVFIRAYIDGIGKQPIRQMERGLYYAMIQNGLTEVKIESGLKYLQTHGAPDSGEKCPHLMACLVRYLNQPPFDRFE